jgi:formyltetrahydrofolate synthetase
MSNIAGFVSFTLFVCVFVFVGIVAIKTRSQNIKLKLQIVDLVQTNEILKQSLNSKDNSQVEKTEGFLNFITQSRDWAFQYIEEVQIGLNKFIKDIEPEIKYFKEYGDVMGMQPNYYSMKKIVECYEELKMLLPEEENQ